MTEARLVTKEQLAAALRTSGRIIMPRYAAPPEWQDTDGDGIDEVFAALPVAAPAEGLREALRELRQMVLDLPHNYKGWPDFEVIVSRDAVIRKVDAALARHESAGSE